MYISEVSVRNFMSFKDGGFKFKNGGMTLIRGENGVGKSSVPCDALSWCIFGQTVRGARGDEVVNRQIKKNCVVSATLKAHGKVVEITRTRKDESLGNSLVWSVDGEERRGGTEKMTQDDILEFLKVDFNLFRCSVLFAQEETFNFVSATDREQKNILGKIRRVDFDERLKNIKTKLAEIEQDVNEKMRDIDKIEGSIPSDDEIADWKEREGSYDEVVSEKIKTNKKVILDAKNRLAEIPEIGDDEYYLKEIEIKEGGVEALETKARSLSVKVAKVSAKVATLEEKVEEALEVEGKCPVCFQETDPDLIAGVVLKDRDEIERLNGLVEKGSERLKSLGKKVLLKKKSLKKLKRSREECREAAIESDKLREIIRHRQKTIEDLEAAVNPWTDRLMEAENKELKSRSKIKSIEASLKRISHTRAIWGFWRDAFGNAGIKSFLFDSLCATLTDKTNHYLSIMSDSISVEFDTQTTLKSGEVREKFECVVCVGGEKMPFRTYSGGEKRRISLAVDMALSDLMTEYYGDEFNVVVFDEQDFYLDGNGRDGFLALLKEISQKKHVIVISHDEELKSFFEDTVDIVKDSDGFSKAA